MLARSHFQQKVQMQPPLENMKNFKLKKNCENEVECLHSSDIGPFKSAVENLHSGDKKVRKCTFANNLLKTLLS